jgi:hypothetical protein
LTTSKNQHIFNKPINANSSFNFKYGSNKPSGAYTPKINFAFPEREKDKTGAKMETVEENVPNPPPDVTMTPIITAQPQMTFMQMLRDRNKTVSINPSKSKK